MRFERLSQITLTWMVEGLLEAMKVKVVLAGILQE